MRNLVLNGGPHPFDQTTPRLVRMLTDSRIASTVHDDIEEGLDVLSRDPHDLLTVHCLRWTMLQSPKYAPLQATWAYVPSEAARAAIIAHLNRGGGLLGLHTAAISFDTWPEWRECLGARWSWGVSHHQPLGTVEVSIDRHDHPVTRGVEPFTCEDEAYAQMDVAPGAEVLARARAGEDAHAHAAVLVQEGRFPGRTAYVSLGHGASTFEHPDYRRLVSQAAAWCCRTAT